MMSSFYCPQQPSRKIETKFYNTIQRLKTNHYDKYIVRCILKLCYVATFCTVDRIALHSTNQNIFTFMMVSLIANYICIWPYAYQRWKYFTENKQNLFYFLTIASQAQTTQHQIDWATGYKWSNCVDPNIYCKTQRLLNNDPQSSSPRSIKRQNQQADYIKISNYRFCGFWTNQFISLITIALIIYAILTLTINSPSNIQIPFLILYFILQLINLPCLILALLAILFLVLALPILLCTFVCIGCWMIWRYCRSGSGGSGAADNNNVLISGVKQATVREIQLSGGSCSICLQDLSIGDKIKSLPCDEKHIFHEICITTWLRFSQTCPMCRSQLPRRI